jgi:hypothetical protein
MAAIVRAQLGLLSNINDDTNYREKVLSPVTTTP